MTKTNEHISKYLNWYISNECENLRFAVLVKGGWGSGKTWFIKNFIKDNENNLAQSKPSESNFIYISLYGLEVIEDIADQIFQKLHPLLSDKKLVFLGNLGRSLIDKHIVELPNYDLYEALNKFGNKVLVFDDLERCNIPVAKVFGYINSFVEHKSKKVILIANDEEIEGGLSEEEKKQGSKYHQIKEKVIGKTFKIETDIPTVLDSLIEENAHTSKAILLVRKKLLLEIFEIVKNKTEKKNANYRAFSHAIKDFEYVWEKLDLKYKEHDELALDFLNLFMRFAYELQLGLITEQDVSNIEAAENTRIYGRTKNSAEKEQQDLRYKAIEAFLNRHEIQSDNRLLSSELWTQILCETIIDLSEIQKSFDNSKHFINKKKVDWVSLWHFIELEDDYAVEIVNSIAKKLGEHQFVDPGEVFHVYGSLLRRKEEGFDLPVAIGNTSEEIEEHGRNYIDYLYKTEKLPNGVALAKKYMDFGYGGLGYTSLKTEHFEKIRTYFLEKCREKQLKLEPAKIDELLRYLMIDPREFYGRIALPVLYENNEDLNYWNVPIFGNMDPTRFFDTYKTIPNAYKSWVNEAFKDRYKNITHHDPQLKVEKCAVLGELDFMNKLFKIVDNMIRGTTTFTPTIWHLKHFKNDGLKIAIEGLEELSRRSERQE